MDEHTAGPTLAAAPRAHLVWSLLAAAIFFLPTGLLAIAFSWRSRVLSQRGEFDSARRFSRAAVVFVVLSIVVGVIVYAALIGALLALGAFSGGG